MVVSVAKQIVLSVAGTLAATFLLTFVHPRTPSPLAALQIPADLTSGGKFAARAEPGDADQNALVTLTAFPGVLPLFTGQAVPPIDLARQPAVAPFLATASIATSLLGPSMAPHVLQRVEAKRRIEAETDVAPSPAPQSIPVALAGSMTPMATEDGMWSTSKRLARHLAGLGGVLLERIVP